MDYQELTLSYFLTDILGVNLKSIAVSFIVIGVVLLFLMVNWVVSDALRRYKDTTIAAIWGLTVLLTNVIGFVLYIIWRPVYTMDEEDAYNLYKKYLEYSLQGIKTCYKCSSVLEEDSLFCTNCGAQVAKKCTSCGQVNDYLAKFCKKCGKQFKATKR